MARDTKKLTKEEALQALKQRYVVDLEQGTVSSRRTRKEVFLYPSEGTEARWWLTIYAGGKYLRIPRSHAVWMVGADDIVPDGWVVHHHNRDHSDDRFCNLFALHAVDHKKTHNGVIAPKEELPF